MTGDCGRGLPRRGDPSRRVRRAVPVLGLLVCALAAPVTARSQQMASALESDESATNLTRRSLECLRRGEGESTNDAKLASYREGLALAKRAITADDSNADAHFAAFANNGRILLIQGVSVNFMTLLNASHELDRALEINPNHADALGAKGGLYRQLPWMLGGNMKKAETYLSRAVELDPNTILPRIELAEIYRDLGQPERSVPLLEQAVDLGTRQNKPYRVSEARKLLSELAASE